MSLVLRGLTLWRPWSAAIVHGPKRVENRPWHPPMGYIDRGLWIAIHAGKTWDKEGAAFIREHWPEARATIPRGTEEGIVGVARVTQALRIEDMALGLRDPFAFGPWCWTLDSVHALESPIQIRGAQGLWSLPPEVDAWLRPLCVVAP